MRVQLVEAAHRVGRDPAKIEVTSLLPTSVGDTREAALPRCDRVSRSMQGSSLRYNRMMAEHGHPVEAAAIAETWARGDREAAGRAVSDDLIYATGVAGTPEQCRAGSRLTGNLASTCQSSAHSPVARTPNPRGGEGERHEERGGEGVAPSHFIRINRTLAELRASVNPSGS